MANGMSFYRKPTEDERRDFIPVIDPGRREKTAKQKFMEELGKKKLEANKKGLPFFKKAAMDEFNDYYLNEVKKNIRKNGYLKTEEIKPLQIDWNKFSDLKNFKVIEEGEIYDEHLSRMNHLPVYLKKTKYKYKGYDGYVTVMENREEAIARARENLNKPEEKKSNSQKRK